MITNIRIHKSEVITKINLLFRILNTIFCILLLTNCAAKNADVEKPVKDYFAILSDMTRSKKVIVNMESKLFIFSTYKNLVLREAYIEEYAKRYQMDKYQKVKLSESEYGSDEKFNEFFVAVYTPDERWNDFDESSSIWKIYLEDEKGNRVSPIDIKKVNTQSPLIREFYPYLDSWSSGYIIRFPKYTVSGETPFPGKDADYIKLVVTSVVGNVSLEWHMK